MNAIKDAKNLLSGRELRHGRQYDLTRWLIHYARLQGHHNLWNIYKSFSDDKEDAFNDACDVVKKRFREDIGYTVVKTFVWGNTYNFTVAFEIEDRVNDKYIYLVWTKEHNYYIVSDDMI